MLPEGDDERTLRRPSASSTEGVRPRHPGRCRAIEASPYAHGARIVDVRTAERASSPPPSTSCAAQGPDARAGEALMDDVLYFGVMMVKRAGRQHGGRRLPRHGRRAASLQILKTAPGVKLVSSFFVMWCPTATWANGAFLFSDCGLECSPMREAGAHA
ncbi:MAG: phosphate acyltransferase [Eggerthellaceae bacterium]